MDRLEAATAEWLRNNGHFDAQHEPLGESTFPDFLTASGVLVECTRLNKIVQDSCGRAQNATARAGSLTDTLKRAIESYRSCKWASSHFVNVHMRRLCTNAELRRAVISLIDRFESRPVSRDDLKLANDIISVRFSRASKHYDSSYRLGGYSAPHSSGWVVPDLLNQVGEAFSRKTNAVMSCELQPTERWLSVSGSVTVSLTDESFSEFSSEYEIPDPWTGLVLIDMVDLSRSRFLGTPSCGQS